MTKKLLSALFVLTLSGFAIISAQEKNPTASFAVESHDFGKINETDGPASFQFGFTNLGGVPLILKNVQASCGCTTPNWPREPILPGAKGVITVTYNPAGRPGRFDKTITVTSNGNPETQILKISGEVIPKQPTIEDQFPNNIEGLRLRSTQIPMNNINPGDKSTQTVEVYNSTDQPMKVNFADVPKHITISAKPETIKPKSKGSIEVTYDAATKNDWGFLFDNVRVVINDKPNPSSRLSVSANIQEDFSKLSEEQKQNAPKILVDNVNFDFDTIKQGDNVNHEFVVKNVGKSDLLIRKVTPSCGCTVTSLKSQLIKPGESTSIAVEFHSAGKSGNQNKTITVISNDPLNSKVILWIKGTVK